MKRCIILANFGGPRNLDEVEEFLKALLTDQDVVRTNLPQFLHTLFFNRIAKKRALKVRLDYESIGGKSPIYSDTEAIAEQLKSKLKETIFTFHRYLPKTHSSFIQKLKNEAFDRYLIFPLFPQFTYATTGSIAKWFANHLETSLVNKIRWIKSYPSHPLFIKAHINAILDFLLKHSLKEEETYLLFSAHGLPQKFVLEADPYEDECYASYNSVMSYFPKAKGLLSFQSKFGKDEWLRPYTSDVCTDIANLAKGKKNVVVIPISFTSDHIETLFEVEQEYLPPIKKQGLNAYRVPALTLREDWIHAIINIIEDKNLCNNQMLVRK
ncbi:MAG: ferrochelatase [Chlamydiales bacterium]|nr:ferrochelatase [Chlamydiales bacterium]